MIRSPATVALAALTLLGCQETLEIRYETEHLRIGTSFDEPLCLGDLERMEAQIAKTEALLGTSLEHRVDVYLWSVEDWPPQGDWCGAKHQSSCYDPVRRTIHAQIPDLPHELVHPVISSVADPPAFIGEGMAEGLAMSRQFFAMTSPSENLNHVAPELDYGAAAHFSRWLLARYGEERYRALLRAEGSAREALERSYDRSIDSLEQEYFVDASYSYGPLVACEHSALAQVDDQRWFESIEVDCGSSDTFGGPLGMGSYRLLEIESRDDYAFSTSAPILTIARCMEDLLDQPWPGDPEQGDVPATTPVFRQQFVRVVSNESDPVVLDLAPGRYELSLVYPDHDARSGEVSVWRHRGPTPVTP